MWRCLYFALNSLFFASPDQTTAPTTTPATRPVVKLTETIAYPNAGVSFRVPAGWVRRIGSAPTELYSAYRPRTKGPLLSLVVACKLTDGKTARQIADEEIETLRRMRRRIELTSSQPAQLEAVSFFEVAGRWRIGRRARQFLRRYLKRDNRCYVTVVAADLLKPEQDRTAEVRAFSDALCRSLRFSDPQDPSARLYSLGTPRRFIRLGFELAVPEAWRWTSLTRESRYIVAACGLMDYQRGLSVPALLLRLEYCPPGITVEQIVEGAYRAAQAELPEGQTMRRLFSGPSELSGKRAADLLVSVLADKPYTEARRTIVYDNRALTIILRYGGADNLRALKMLERVAASFRLIEPSRKRPRRPARMPAIRPAGRRR